MTTFNTVSVIGLGYIGLPTAAMFASRKINVIGVDISQHAVDTINEGKIHIVEPDLDMLVSAAVTAGFFKGNHHGRTCRRFPHRCANTVQREP